MFDKKKMEELQIARDQWEETTLQQTLARVPERSQEFITASSKPVERLYTPLDLPDFDYMDDLGFPGEYPFTRGIHATGHRGKLWTMRMFAGFGTAEETNARYKYLLSQGNMGLSVAFDLPTLMGYDTDAPESLGEFGKCGVAISSLRDMEILMDGIPLGEVSTSMTINSPAAVIWAFYIAAAEKQGVSMDKLRGTLQNDILKEFTAQKEFIFPPEPSMRLVTDTIEFGTQHLPQWNTISISGYHIREAGSTAAQELAFTLADGLEYVRWALLRGSYFLEKLKNDMEAEVYRYFQGIEDLGGVLPAIEKGFFQQKIADAAFVYQREIDEHRRTIVGVNDYADNAPMEIPILEMDPKGYDRQVARLAKLPQERANGKGGAPPGRPRQGRSAPGQLNAQMPE